MAITKQQVEHVARLARIGLTAAEVERLADELSKILDFVEKQDAYLRDTADTLYYVHARLQNAGTTRRKQRDTLTCRPHLQKN